MSTKIELICGDTLTTLRGMPSDSVDAVVTSPPYNKQDDKLPPPTVRIITKDVKYAGVTDSVSEDVYQSQQIAVLDELLRVTRPGGSIFYNHKVRFRDGSMIHPMQWILRSRVAEFLRQEIIWHRVLAAQVRGWRFHQTDERIYWVAKGKIPELAKESAKLTAVWKVMPQDGRKNNHPAPFPVEIPRRCIRAVLPSSSGVVLDPYCGSGTTGVAAQALGHSFVGIDIVPAYVEMARERINGARAWLQE